MLNKTFLDLKMAKKQEMLIGPKNHNYKRQLQNKGHIKRLLTDYMRNAQSGQRNEVSYDKREFIPFAEERDHIGRLIQNVCKNIFYALTYSQEYQDYQKFTKPYVKKVLVFKPRKSKDLIEITDEIPRRWKEKSNSPLKNQAYFDKKDFIEYGKLKESFVPVR